ncbi:MAG: TlpA family protein disulfide reductase [Ancrocorticia sp.]|uniref:TlpA family protein disulfide reductase n=1 Tax=Ancrocorticia sp. TaxID=2593684 RepID=UPI003F91667F
MSRDAYTLLFVTAQWCDPGTAMLPIFEETLRDFSRLYPDVELRGDVVDIDEEEENAQSGIPTTVGASILETVTFVPSMLLLRGGARTGTEVTRLVGQLPKLAIRRKLADALGVHTKHEGP